MCPQARYARVHGTVRHFTASRPLKRIIPAAGSVPTTIRGLSTMSPVLLVMLAGADACMRSITCAGKNLTVAAPLHVSQKVMLAVSLSIRCNAL